MKNTTKSLIEKIQKRLSGRGFDVICSEICEIIRQYEASLGNLPADGISQDKNHKVAEKLIGFMQGFRNRIFYFMTRNAGENNTKSYDLLGELKEMMTDTINHFGGGTNAPAGELGRKELNKKLKEVKRCEITEDFDELYKKLHYAIFLGHHGCKEKVKEILSPYLKRESIEQKELAEILVKERLTDGHGASDHAFELLRLFNITKIEG